MSRHRKLNFILLSIALVGALLIWLYASNFDTLPQTSLSLLQAVASPSSTDRILVVSPHPDDETLGAGGYIQATVSAGGTAEVVFATDGNKHGLADIRHAEAVSATAKLGLNENQLVFFNFPDGNLSAQNDFQTKLDLEISRFKPTVVITTLSEDQHPDHATCGRAVSAIQKAHPNTFKVYYFLIHYSRYPRPLDDIRESYLLPPLGLISEKYDWRVFPLSAEYQIEKETAIRSYKTQLSLKNPILRQLLLSFERRNELFVVVGQ